MSLPDGLGEEGSADADRHREGEVVQQFQRAGDAAVLVGVAATQRLQAVRVGGVVSGSVSVTAESPQRPRDAPSARDSAGRLGPGISSAMRRWNT
ncbi:hypothetical protein IEE94_07945 [Yimella sp. cx-573]|nr:hypothetical protein [Yimella sp. cx-573]